MEILKEDKKYIYYEHDIFSKIVDRFLVKRFNVTEQCFQITVSLKPYSYILIIDFIIIFLLYLYLYTPELTPADSFRILFHIHPLTFTIIKTYIYIYKLYLKSLFVFIYT